jgi:hypothetical protein
VSQGASSWPLWGQLLIEFVRLLVSALVSAFIAVKVVNRLKSQSDHVEKRIDDICADIRAVADLASDYWLKPPANDLKPVEARIAARIRLIEELRSATSYVAPEINSDAVLAASQEFLREVTGGDFGVHNRDQDFDRACNAQHLATRFIATIRRTRIVAHGAPKMN